MRGKKVISVINNARVLKENNGGNIILECLKLSYNLPKVKRILLICVKGVKSFFSLLKNDPINYGNNKNHRMPYYFKITKQN